MQISELKTLQDKIEYLLEDDENTRNSDIYLYKEFIKLFYPNSLVRIEDDYLIPFYELSQIPSYNTIVRIRQKFQSAKGKKPQYLPTYEEVRIKRQINEEVWRLYLGYDPEMRTLL